ncbi:glycosyltransferase family 1 protein [Polynucleobacter paneuropaeus]|uniref:glycosyltransferase family 4 protein n=1 Tax=Polynucleobacter paneuropaeus TaxID=2527775 RepID=UPI000DBF2276|nr:glycosyltransferase family 1 protein [Polynucleobacter paneuropaeus]AWW45644.1 glycosyltransferase family 1 protein [Polynucleobacter paneuropaeus]
MHLGIDATNIHQGGGVTHLVQLLSAASPREQGISKITVWCSPKTAALFPEKPWLKIRSGAWMEGGSLKRFFFQHLFLSLEMRRAGCEIVFFPGGTLPLISLLPPVTISQNMLPFELDKAALFGRFSLMYLKFCALRLLQSISFNRAVGIIFLSKYAQDKINKCVKINGLQKLIPHGIEPRFIGKARIQKSIDAYSITEPFRFLYVSILMPYKHQIEVIRAIKELRDSGWPIALDLIGPFWSWYGKAVQNEINNLDPDGDFIQYLGEKPFEALHCAYQKSDAFIFASSCENLPNILIEAMASGIPVACSSEGPMPEILGIEGIYFDPRIVFSIKNSLSQLMSSPEKRALNAKNASIRVGYSPWTNCANKTFELINKCYENYCRLNR